MSAAIMLRAALSLLWVAINSSPVDRIRANNILVVPGKGAESILLGDGVDEVLFVKGHPDRVVEIGGIKDLLKDIFRLVSDIRICYDRIYYFETKGLIVFIEKGVVVAIAGLNNNRVTNDSVSLAKGADYFLFSYGNKDLNVLVNGDNRLYLYPKLGIAVADDKCDDIVDMYIVFPEQREAGTRRER
ncbi:MAG: hypothetical protein SVZ03_10865 [Spirochaetota bacterium]|nr:hypothetical protein [Spirochaetota bacterium]